MGAAGVTAGAAVVGAGASAYGAMSKKGGGASSGSSAGTTQTAPWQPQQQMIIQGLQEGQGVYQAQRQAGPYPGQMVAGGNPNTTQAGIYAGNFANGTGNSLVNQEAGAAGALNGATAPYVGNASSIAANGITGPGANLEGTLQAYGTGQQSVQGANPALSSALNNSAVAGANGLQGFQSTLSNAANKGLSDPTQQISSDAQTYANSPQVQASLKATNDAINQTLNQSTLPTQNQQEAQAGALNSSRSGMAEGMARQAAATSEGQADAAIENNAYNTGMGTASNLYSSGLNTATTAGSAGYNDLANNANTQSGQQIGLSETNAANQMSAANSGLNFATNNTNAQLNANSQLGNASGMGINADNSAINGATSNYNLAATGGLLQQQMQQAGDTNAYDMYQTANNYGTGILQSYMGIVGAPYGQQGATSGIQQQQTQLPQNMLGSALGAGVAANGLYNQTGANGDSNGNNLYNSATSGMTGVQDSYGTTGLGTQSQVNQSNVGVNPGFYQQFAQY